MKEELLLLRGCGYHGGGGEAVGAPPCTKERSLDLISSRRHLLKGSCAACCSVICDSTASFPLFLPLISQRSRQPSIVKSEVGSSTPPPPHPLKPGSHNVIIIIIIGRQCERRRLGRPHFVASPGRLLAGLSSTRLIK